MPPNVNYKQHTLEHNILQLAKNFRRVGITLEEFDVVRFILIQEHITPNTPISIKQIAEGIDKTTRAVQQHLRSLEGKQALEKIPHFNEDRGRAANTYDFSRLFQAIEEVIAHG